MGDRIVHPGGLAASGTTDEVVRTEGPYKLYGQHVGRADSVVAGRGDGELGEDATALCSQCRTGTTYLLTMIVEPGFFGNGPVRGGHRAVVAWRPGSSACSPCCAGVRRACAGGCSAQPRIGRLPRRAGFVGIGVVAAGVMEMIGIRGRAAGTWLHGSSGGVRLAALFLYWGTTFTNSPCDNLRPPPCS